MSANCILYCLRLRRCKLYRVKSLKRVFNVGAQRKT